MWLLMWPLVGLFQQRCGLLPWAFTCVGAASGGIGAAVGNRLGTCTQGLDARDPEGVRFKRLASGSRCGWLASVTWALEPLSQMFHRLVWVVEQPLHPVNVQPWPWGQMAACRSWTRQDHPIMQRSGR